jgi:hypothetical protein
MAGYAAPSVSLSTVGIGGLRAPRTPFNEAQQTDQLVSTTNTRSPVSRQCPKTCPNVCARTDTRWTSGPAELHVLDTSEHRLTRSCRFTHQRSAVRYRPRPPLIMQVSAIQRSYRQWQANPRCAKSVPGGFAHPVDSPRAVASPVGPNHHAPAVGSSAPGVTFHRNGCCGYPHA